MENLIRSHGDRPGDEEFYGPLNDELRTLHARMRIHHPAGARPNVNENNSTPECFGELEGLCAEHTTFLGKLDRLMRAGKSMAGRTSEDQAVFTLQLHELTAMVRRHEAEERRLMYLAIWRDTGGES
jgi:hypothetical protein